MKKIILALLLLVFVVNTNAQDPNTSVYQSKTNEHYWKNSKPYEGYWQQDVHYGIDARIDDLEESISATEDLVYTNNSPDTLYEVYFHLYQNAFTPNSYAHELRKSGKLETVFGEHEANGLGTVINTFRIDGEDVEFSIDNTILHAKLKKPLLPGKSIKFFIDFKTYWDKDDQGNMRRRMKTFEHRGYTHFDGVHWYPRICVYDRKFGWTTDQHLGKEFYGDFGQFDVYLTFPNHYIVEATGWLTNEDEVMPKELRESIDLKRYKTERTDITQPIKPDGTTKTWKFHAINVHDFAFTADPTYRIGEVEWNGVKCIALAMEEHAHQWQGTAQFVADVIKTYSEDFGMYLYPKMIAADARDGMEYPMLTLDGGVFPSHKNLLAHEIGHNWFFGMVGNNETYRASLDEGFTQFLTAWAMKKIHHQDVYDNPYDKYIVFYSYLKHASNENSAVLETHSDYFNSADRHGGGYSQVYYKTASMLYNLQYVLGDELFLAAMKNYFDQWKLCHPYFEDFRSSIIRYTKVDLNWFFDQWLNTNKYIDYGIKSVKRDGSTQTITFERKTSMHMPLDIEITYANGNKEMRHIPNTYFTKETDAVVHKPWIGWDAINEEYQLVIEGGEKIVNVQIDPSNRLSDIYKLDNSKKFPMEASYNNYKAQFNGFDKYNSTYEVFAGYNAVDGLKPGIRLTGNYAEYKHIYDLRVFYATGALANRDNDSISPISYRLDYRNRIVNQSDFVMHSRWLDGLVMNQIGIESRKNRTTYFLNFKSLYRNSSQDLEYLIYPSQWNEGMWNNSLNLGFMRNYRYMKGDGQWGISTRASALFSDYRYASIRFENLNTQRVGKFKLRTRVIAQLMSGNPAPESALNLAGANNEENMEHPISRSVGFVPQNWEGFGNKVGHFHYGGGLNLRGYSGYKASNSTDNNAYFIYSGLSGWAINAEFDFNETLDPFNKVLSSYLDLNTYLFADAGMLFGGSADINSGLRLDAGVGTALTISGGRYSGMRPLVLRFDLPLILNRLPVGETDYLALRYVIGVSRAF